MQEHLVVNSRLKLGKTPFSNYTISAGATSE